MKKIQGYLREGKSYLALGDYKSALRLFHKIKEIEPNNTSVDADIQSSNELRQLNEMSDSAYAGGDYRKVIILVLELNTIKSKIKIIQFYLKGCLSDGQIFSAFKQ